MTLNNNIICSINATGFTINWSSLVYSQELITGGSWPGYYDKSTNMWLHVLLMWKIFLMWKTFFWRVTLLWFMECFKRTSCKRAHSTWSLTAYTSVVPLSGDRHEDCFVMYHNYTTTPIHVSDYSTYRSASDLAASLVSPQHKCRQNASYCSVTKRKTLTRPFL